MSMTTEDLDLAWPVTLAGVTVTFRGPFEAGSRPAHDLDVRAESVLAAFKGGVDGARLLRLVWGVQTGVEAGVVHPEHFDAISAACGGDKPVKVSIGDEKVSRRVAPFLSTSAAIAATWWVLIHEPTLYEDGRPITPGVGELLPPVLAAGNDDDYEEAAERLAAALRKSIEEAPK